jgi:hypothetical protein
LDGSAYQFNRDLQMAFIADYSLSSSVWPLAVIAIATGHKFYLSKKLADSRAPSAAAEPTTERRKSPRRAGNPISIYIANPDSKSNPRVGKVTDRSLGGLGILSDHDFEVGAILVIRPVNSIDLTPWCQIEVLARRKIGSRWRLNCRFTNPIPSSVFLLFG